MSSSASAPPPPRAPPPAPPLDPRLKQHRCHARLADVVHAVMTLALPAAPARVALLVRCYASAVGAEPAEPFLVDPAVHALRMRSFAVAPAERKAAAP